MEEKQTKLCCKCDVFLEPARINFEYLGHAFHAEMLRCPQCGQVYIPEEMTKNRMAEVEAMLEDK